MPLIACPECTQSISDRALACPHCGLQSSRRRHKLPALLAVTCVFVIIASIGEVAGVLRATILTAAAPYGSLENNAYTSASEAHLTLTNTTPTTRFACFRGVVKATSGRSAPVYSAEVCSGDLKPHTTISLEAPYEPGAVDKICDSPEDRFGLRRIDWDLCTFTVEPVSAL
jgi:hypothetical protein